MNSNSIDIDLIISCGLTQTRFHFKFYMRKFLSTDFSTGWTPKNTHSLRCNAKKGVNSSNIYHFFNRQKKKFFAHYIIRMAICYQEFYANFVCCCCCFYQIQVNDEKRLFIIIIKLNMCKSVSMDGIVNHESFTEIFNSGNNFRKQRIVSISLCKW